MNNYYAIFTWPDGYKEYEDIFAPNLIAAREIALDLAKDKDYELQEVNIGVFRRKDNG